MKIEHMETNEAAAGLTIPPIQPKRDLNEYLLLPWNVEINQLLSDWKMTEKERLNYMNYLYFQLQIVLVNLERPSFLVRYLMSLYPDDDFDAKIDMAFLLENLHIIMTYSPEYKDPQLKGKMDIIIDMMDDEAYRIYEEVDPETYGDGVLRSIRRMLSYANTSDDPQEEIKRALVVKVALQENAVLYGDSPEIIKAIKLIDIELRRLSWVYSIPLDSENEGIGTGQMNSERSRQQDEEEPDHSDLLKALSKYITRISAPEFNNIINHHSLTPGTPQALWIGKPADAHRFATFIKMKVAVFNKYIELSCGRKLRANDKNITLSPIISILETHLGK